MEQARRQWLRIIGRRKAEDIGIENEPRPLAGAVPVVASPIRLSATPVQLTQAAPTLGEHSDMLLRERLGLSDQRIAELRSRNII